MGMSDDLMGLSEKEKADYAESETEAYYANIKDGEFEADETSFKDEDKITLEDLQTSPYYKSIYSKRISASNWNEWILGIKKRCLA